MHWKSLIATTLRTAAAACLLAALPAGLHAGLLITFSDPSPVSYAGVRVGLNGTLTNDSATDTLWLDGANINLPDPYTLFDIDLTFAGWPFSLAPLEVTSEFEFFGVINPDPLAPGLYAGVFEVLGRVNDDPTTVSLQAADFSIDVQPGAAVPEPAGIGCLAGVLAALAVRLRRQPLRT